MVSAPERFRGGLYPDLDGPRFVIRVVDPEPDLADALAAARHPGTFIRTRRGWIVEDGHLMLRFEMLEPRHCETRTFYLGAPELLTAFLDGCAVSLYTRPAGTWPRRGVSLVPLWDVEEPRTDVLDALAPEVVARLEQDA